MLGGCHSWEAIWGAFPDLRFQIKDRFIALDGCRAALQWKGGGTMRGRLVPPGYSPTGQRVEMRGTDVFEFRAELLSYMESSSEAFAAARQVGALPPAGSAIDRMGVLRQRLTAWRMRRRGS